MSDMIQCFGCGKEIHSTAMACPSCGAQLKHNVLRTYKSKIVAGILALFFGYLGIHKFYLGQINLGILYLCCTFFGFILSGIPSIIITIVAVVEAIVYFCTSDEVFNNKYNS